MRQPSHDAAVALYRRCGLLTPALLRGVGVSHDAAERAVEAGLWRRPVRGHYVPHARPCTPLELARGAAAYVRAPCVVTGLVALSRWSPLWLPPIDHAHVLVADRVRRGSQGPYVVQRTPQWDLLPTDRAFGLRWAAPERAVIDAARAAESLREARGIVLGSVGAGLATADELAAVLATTRRNGSGVARRAVTDAARGCASPPEAELVDALLPLRVPFLVNPEIWVDGVHLGDADVWIVGTAVGGEVESREWHEGAEREESTYDRHERFVASGLDLVHLGVRRLRRDLPGAARYLVQRALSGPSAGPAAAGARRRAAGSAARRLISSRGRGRRSRAGAASRCPAQRAAAPRGARALECPGWGCPGGRASPSARFACCHAHRFSAPSCGGCAPPYRRLTAR